jgi:hypothetical protein
MNPLCSVSLCQAPHRPSLDNLRVQAHVSCWVHSLRNEHCDNQTVDCDDTGHDDGDEGLWIEIQLATQNTIEPAISGLFRTFMIRSDLKVPTPAMPMPDFAVP